MAEVYVGTRFQTVFEVRDSPDDPRIASLIACCRRLAALGLAGGGAGNVSIRASPGFLISRTGADLGAIGPREFVHVLRADAGRREVTAGGAFEPSSESLLHAAVYEGRPDAGAVLHVHADHLVEAAEELGLPVTAREQPYGTPELAAEAARLLGNDLFVLRHHGVVALGAGVVEARRLIEALVAPPAR